MKRYHRKDDFSDSEAVIVAHHKIIEGFGRVMSGGHSRFDDHDALCSSNVNRKCNEILNLLKNVLTVDIFIWKLTSEFGNLT